MDALEFLRRTHPFDALSADALTRVVDAISVSYHPTGTVLLRAGESPNEEVLILRQGSVRLDREGRGIMLLEAGDVLGYPSVISEQSPTADAVVVDDVLAYHLPATRFRQLLEIPAVSDHFTRGLAERLQANLRPPSPADTAWYRSIGSIARRPVVSVPAATSVADAARRMREGGISSVLVEDPQSGPVGIVTDRDLRNRVVAEGLGPETPVSEVASFPAVTVDGRMPAFEALLTMLRHGIHHLPVELEGRVDGMVTNSDLLRTRSVAPSFLHRRIERAESRDMLAGYADQLADLVAQLVASGVDGLRIGSVVAALNDTVVRTALRLARDDLGSPTYRISWLALGSEGRGEQTLLTDQDNAIVHEGSAEPAGHASALADHVVATLIAAGFPPCHGGYMANNWSGTVETWERRFASWRAEADPDALLASSVFFDLRPVTGDLDVTPLQDAIAGSSEDQVFVRRLASTALRHRPPVGLLGRLREADDGIDLKSAGLMPIVLLARVLAIEVGSRARSTADRLAAATVGPLSEEGAETLTEAYRYLMTLRLRVQLDARRSARSPTNHVRLEDLTGLERRHLRDVLAAIRKVQDATAQRMQTGLMGGV